MSFPPAVVDHASAAVARLAQWAKDRPNINAFLNAINASSQALEVALQDLVAKRVLDVATGDQLDQLGDLVGQSRAGATDADYRQRIRARIKVNRSSGTTAEILAIFRVLYAVGFTGLTLTFLDEFPAAFSLVLAGVRVPSGAIGLEFMRLARAAGVYGVFIWPGGDPHDMLYFDKTLTLGLDRGMFSNAQV